MTTFVIEGCLERYSNYCRDLDVQPNRSILRLMRDSIRGDELLEELILIGSHSDMRYNRINGQMLGVILKSFDSQFLKKLDLSCNDIGDNGAIIISRYLDDDSTLSWLSLKFNDIKDIGCRAICTSIQSNASLLHLDLSGNSLGQAGGFALSDMLQSNDTLSVLALNDCDLACAQFISLCTALENNHTLLDLNLSGNRCHSLTTDILVHLSKSAVVVNNTITNLSLAKLGIQDYHVTLLIGPALARNFNIENLDLSCNNIGIDGAVALSIMLKENRTIMHLNLSCCNLLDGGIISLSASIKNSKLVSLNLNYNQLTGSGLTILAKEIPSSPLSVVKLWGNSFDSESIAALSEIKNVKFDISITNGSISRNE